jgi:hypothetical protein
LRVPYSKLLWHVGPFLGNDRKISSYTTDVARQWLSSDHVGIPTDANTTEDWCFLHGPCQDVINGTTELVRAMS